MRADVVAEKLGEEHREKAGEHGTQQEEQQLFEEAGERPFFLGQSLLRDKCGQVMCCRRRYCGNAPIRRFAPPSPATAGEGRDGGTHAIA